MDDIFNKEENCISDEGDIYFEKKLQGNSKKRSILGVLVMLILVFAVCVKLLVDLFKLLF